MSSNAEIVATGDKWIGYGITPTEDVIDRQIKQILTSHSFHNY